MTNHAPLDEPIRQILDTYNPLEIKDILLNGSWRKAIHHKEWSDVLEYYTENASYIHTTTYSTQVVKHGTTMP